MNKQSSDIDQAILSKVYPKSKDFIFSITDSGKFQYANSYFLNLIEYNSDEVESLNFFSLLDYYSQKKYRELFYKESKEDKLILTITTKKGNQIIISGLFKVDFEGSFSIFNGVFQDVTLYERSLKRLTSNEAKFKVLFEKSLNPIMYYSSKGILDCNQALLDILEYDSKEEVIGKMPSYFSAKKQPGIDNPEKEAWKADNIAQQEGGHQFNWMHKSKSGRDIYVSVTLTLVTIEGKLGYFSMWNDLSVQFESDKQLESSKIEIEETNARLHLINKINQHLISDVGFWERMKAIVKLICLGMNLDSANISVFSNDKSDFTSYGYEKENDSYFPGKKYPINELPELTQLLEGDFYEVPNLRDVKAQTETVRYLKNKDFHTAIFAPLSRGSNVDAVLILGKKDELPLTENDYNFILDVSTSLTSLIDQFKRLKNTGERDELLTSVQTIGNKILTILEVEELTKRIYSEVNDLIKAPIFGIGVHNESKNKLEFNGIIEYDKILPSFSFDLDVKENLAAKSFLEQKEYLINDLERDMPKYVPNYKREVAPGDQPNSLIYLPLVFAGNSIGVVSIQSYSKNEYTDQDMYILRSLSQFITIALNNALAYDKSEELVDRRTQEIILEKIKLQKLRKRQELVSRIGRKIASKLDMQELFDDLREEILNVMDVASFGIRIYNEEKQVVEYQYEYEYDLKLDYVEVPMSNDNNYSVWCIKNNDFIFINNNEEEFRKYVKEIHVPLGDMTQSLIFYPIRLQNKAVGLITIQSYAKSAFNQGDLDLINALSNYISLAMENAKNYHELATQLKKTEED